MFYITSNIYDYVLTAWEESSVLSGIVDPVDGEIISPRDRFPDPASVNRDLSVEDLYAEEE